MDDPWQWTTERVVQELCTPQRSWQPLVAGEELPAAVSVLLEEKLRKEEVKGYILLAFVDATVMKDDLGLEKLSWRVYVICAIETFRRRSAHYQQYKLEHHTESHALSHHTPSLAGVGYSQRIQIPPTPPAQQQSPLIPNPVLPGESLDQVQALTTPIDSRAARGEFIVSDDNGNKRRKLDLTNTASNLALQNESRDFYDIPELEQETLQTENDIPTPTPDPTEINVKKRKRIAPTLITSEIDPNRDRDIPTAADNVVHNDPQKIEPGVLFRGEDGRKRLVPVHQPGAESDEPYDYQALLETSRASDANLLEEGSKKSLNALEILKKIAEKKVLAASTKLDVGYLGKKKISVDDIFYQGIPVGQELSPRQEPEEFSVPQEKIANGRRIYMHRVVKRYLNSERTVLLRGGKFFSAVRPYSANLIPRHLKPSFTLYYTSDEGQIHARRENLELWPEVDPEAVPQMAKTDIDGNQVIFNTSRPGILDAVGSYDPLDPEVLKKYNHIKGGDEVLPIYGESDEENEYDMETWKEMEDEQGALEKPMKPLSKPQIPDDEVYEAIDESISGIVEKWQKQKLPDKKYKALKIWNKYPPKTKPRTERLRQRQAKLEQVNGRITKMRREIANNIWSSQDQVRKQSRILEPSIFDREDWIWEIYLLKSRFRPEKPPPRQTPSKNSSKSKVRIDDGEEGEFIGSQSDASISDDDLDDFIVDDSSPAEDEKELNLADGEDEEDVSMSDVSLPDLSQELPTSRKLFKKLSRSPRGSGQDDDPMPDVSEDPFLSDGSNLDTPVKEEPKLPKLPATSPNSGTEMIDLTMMSSDDGPPVINLVTPRKRKTPLLKLTDRNSPFAISDSDDPQILDPETFPPLEDTAAIAKFSHRVWVQHGDKERLLISVLRGMPPRMRNSIFSLTSNTQSQLWANLAEVMDYIRNDRAGVKGMDDQTVENLCVLIRLFAMFSYCKYYPYREKPSKGQVSGLQYEQASYSDFYAFLQRIEDYFERQVPSPLSQNRQGSTDAAAAADDDEDGEPQSAVRRRRAVNTSDDDDTKQDTPRKPKRKKKIFEDVHARSLRERELERKVAQEERRRKLQASQAEMGDPVGDEGDIIINESKLDDEGFVYVNPHIARLIKKHQIEGVRFMWNQIITDETSLSGCLLAHTMGLGKTMQVITLLVAIAEASSSVDEKIFGQIPSSLRASKTLILCPPGLIDNWVDELLMWVIPKGILGELRKVDATVQPRNRLEIINDWYNDGGVLVMGYEMFRILINNTKRKGAETATLDDEQHKQVLDQLTQGPNIIIADEAHKLKNATAAITLAASQFRSPTRIALTGSPLANNVEEYHSMIEWIKPNYLGPAVEFRAKYVEPIQTGLYVDSTSTERRKALTMLGVLKEDISPKVHRADMSVLRNDLPPKKEFVITVPLTSLQSKAYTMYVKSMMANAIRNKDGEIAQTTLWHWLAILSLLCNHPASFMAKLTERREDAKKGAKANTPVSREVTDQEDVGVDLNTSGHWKVGVSESLVREEQILFTREAADLSSIDLSNKTRILCQILDASKAVGDKTLVFSQSIPTLNFLQKMFDTQGRAFARLDGSTPMNQRQAKTKEFNTGKTDIFLISTTAGGLGLNLWGANRVVIFDFKFNPILEEQAVGRAYRIGQKKDVFVYRFVAGGTFEDSVHNKAIFKKQLASRVVDKKKPIAWASKKLGEFLHEPKEVRQRDLTEFEGMDPHVLDMVLSSQGQGHTIRAIVQTDTFEKDDNDDLTLEEQKQVKEMVSDEQLKRSDPKAYQELLARRAANAYRASVQGPVSTPNPLTGVTNVRAVSVPQRPASGPIVPPRPPLSPPARMNNFHAAQGLATGPNRHPTRPNLNPSNGANNQQQSSSGPILPLSRPGSSSNAPRTSSAMQGPASGSGFQPRSSPAVPKSSMGAPARKGSSPILGANTKIRSDTPDAPGSASTLPVSAKPDGRPATPKGAPAIRSDEVIKSKDRPISGKSDRPEGQKPRNQDTNGAGGNDKDKQPTDSEMYRAMSARPSRSSVRPLRDPVTKPYRQKSKVSSSRADGDPRMKQRVLEKRQKIAQPTSTTQPPSSKSSATSPSSTTRPTLTSSPSKGETRLPNWALDNVRGASLRNGKHDSPTSSHTTTPKG